jgi:hypothetical protein
MRPYLPSEHYRHIDNTRTKLPVLAGTCWRTLLQLHLLSNFFLDLNNTVAQSRILNIVVCFISFLLWMELLQQKKNNKITLAFNNHRQFTPFGLAPLVRIYYKNNSIRISIEKGMKSHFSDNKTQSVYNLIQVVICYPHRLLHVWISPFCFTGDDCIRIFV